jgi:hypothetical protein
MKPQRVLRSRDLVHWHDDEHITVLACDSNAGIGELPGDALCKIPEAVGYSATKVPLMEVIASGAEPFVLANALCGPLDDYGRRILAGVGAAVADSGFDVTITGSDETNMPTVQTGIGITILGRVAPAQWRIGTARPGDDVVCVGIPKDGLIIPYEEADDDIAGLSDLVAVVRSGRTHEVLPVGSRGIAYEAEQLAASAGCAVELTGDLGVHLTVSAGASTCFLAAGPPDVIVALTELTRAPVTPIGRLAALVDDGSDRPP